MFLLSRYKRFLRGMVPVREPYVEHACEVSRRKTAASDLTIDSASPALTAAASGRNLGANFNSWLLDRLLHILLKLQGTVFRGMALQNPRARG